MGIKHATTGAGTKLTNTVWEEAHTWDSDEAALLKWKDSSESVLTLANATSDVNWTDIDLTSTTSSNAKAAYLLLILSANSKGAAGTAAKLELRKNGTTPTEVPTHVIYSDGIATGVIYTEMAIIGTDTAQVIEYSLTLGSGWNVNVEIHVLGYWE